MAARFLIAVVFGVRFLKVKVGAGGAGRGVSVSAMNAFERGVSVGRTSGRNSADETAICRAR